MQQTAKHGRKWVCRGWMVGVETTNCWFSINCTMLGSATAAADLKSGGKVPVCDYYPLLFPPNSPPHPTPHHLSVHLMHLSFLTFTPTDCLPVLCLPHSFLSLFSLAGNSHPTFSHMLPSCFFYSLTLSVLRTAYLVWPRTTRLY